MSQKTSQQLQPKGLSYKEAGVDIEAGNSLVSRIKRIVSETKRTGVLGNIGGFGALFDLKETGYEQPLLVSGTDGVGTKLRLAIDLKHYHTIGIDLVAMCVNDILVQGAEPLFFLDYFACGHLSVQIAEKVISGIANGCKQANCALVGGETAEMPGMYDAEDFDLAGFAVGAVERSDMLPKLDRIQVGDVLIGLPSSGVHSNGYSLVRKLLENTDTKLSDKFVGEQHKTFGQVLLEPTKIYVKCLLPVIREQKAAELKIVALSHITGGGLLENIPRVLPENLAANLDANSWKLPKIFAWLQRAGNLELNEMLRTFNCGLGMIVVVKKQFAQQVLQKIKSNGEPNAVIVGEIVARKCQDDPQVTVANKNTLQVQCTEVSLPRIERPRKRVAVLISGSGTNLQCLIDRSTSPLCSYEIVLVISNKSNVEGVLRSQRAGIETLVINSHGYTGEEGRERYDQLITESLKEYSIELVCLAGFMRILSPGFVNEWYGKLINIHPSLLPSFTGLHTHKRALEAGVRYHGTTVHFVDNGLDTGAIIDQSIVPILDGDNEHSLEERVKSAEHKLYPKVLDAIAADKIRLNTDVNKVERS